MDKSIILLLLSAAFVTCAENEEQGRQHHHEWDQTHSRVFFLSLVFQKHLQSTKPQDLSASLDHPELLGELEDEFGKVNSLEDLRDGWGRSIQLKAIDSEKFGYFIQARSAGENGVFGDEDDEVAPGILD